MATGYNVAGLPAYTSQQSKVFITKTILSAQTIAMLIGFGSFDPTAKGSEAIQLIDTDVVIQENDGCGRNPLGGATLTQSILTVKMMKINQDYCTKDLVKTWAVEELKRTMAGLPYTDALFLEDIGNLNSAKASILLDKMIWQGDTASADTTLKLIDGYIKTIKAAGKKVAVTNPNGYIDLNPAGGAGDNKIITRLQAADALMPIEITDQDDYRLVMGRDWYKRYVAELSAKNLFDQTAGKDMTVWGTTAKAVAVNGLNGTNILIAARMTRLRAGGEMTAAKFEKMYSTETKKTYFDSEFSLGVVPVYINEIGLGDFN